MWFPDGVITCKQAKGATTSIMAIISTPPLLMIAFGISLNVVGVKCGLVTKANNFECHCKSGAYCDPETLSCPSGCDPGWYGPGCQIGNLAYRRKAFQSSNYKRDNMNETQPSGPPMVAEYAVDGALPSATSGESGCSSTDPKANTSLPWWYVVLSDFGTYYVIRNVTIYNRMDSNGSSLRDFSVLVDINTETDPSSREWWHLCAYQQEQPPHVSSYSCGNVIGRRVGITIHHFPSILSLCEVVVDGYKYSRCDHSHTGPGCLNRKCNTELCYAAGGTCGTGDACQFPFYKGLLTPIVGAVVGGAVAVIILLVVIAVKCCSKKGNNNNTTAWPLKNLTTWPLKNSTTWPLKNSAVWPLKNSVVWPAKTTAGWK